MKFVRQTTALPKWHFSTVLYIIQCIIYQSGDVCVCEFFSHIMKISYVYRYYTDIYCILYDVLDLQRLLMRLLMPYFDVLLGAVFFLLCICNRIYGYSDLQCADGERDCCDISDTNQCIFSDLSSEKSTLVFPGGDTSCITSESTPFAFGKPID
jgi:hypothetical protein